MLKKNSSPNIQIRQASVVGGKPFHRYLRVSVAGLSTIAIAVFATGVQFTPDSLRAAEAAQSRFDYTGAYRSTPHIETTSKEGDVVITGPNSEPDAEASFELSAVRSAVPLDNRPLITTTASHRRISYDTVRESAAASHASDKPLPSARVLPNRQSMTIAAEPTGQPSESDAMAETQNPHATGERAPSSPIVKPTAKLQPNVAPAGNDRIIVPELTGRLSNGEKSAKPQPHAGLQKISSRSDIDNDADTEGVALSGAQSAKSAQPEQPTQRQFTEVPAASQPVVIPSSSQSQALDAATSQPLAQAEPEPEVSQFAEYVGDKSIAPLPAAHPLRADRRREQNNKKRTAKRQNHKTVRQENASPGPGDTSTPIPDDNIRPAWALTVFQH